MIGTTARTALSRAFPGSLYFDSLPYDTSRDLSLEVSVGVVEIQLERTGLYIAVVSQIDGLTQMNGPQKVSIGVIAPHAVGELKRAARRLHRGAQANVASPGVDVRVVDFSSAEASSAMLPGLSVLPR